MQQGPSLDVSVVLPFRDDEDRIGNAARRLAAHLRELELSFEIVAVDEASGDNSHAVLALLRNAIPELRLVSAPRGKGMAVGSTHAKGQNLWLIRPRAANLTIAPFSHALGRVTRDGMDVVVVDKRFAVVQRTRVLPILDGIRGTGIYVRLARLAKARGLTAAVHRGKKSLGHEPSSGERPWSRLLGALSLRPRLRASLLERLQ